MDPRQSTDALERPDVFRYLSYHEYLRDWWAWAQRSEPDRLTFDAFALDVGLKHRGSASNIFAGRRPLVPPLTESFADRMGLSVEEADYFSLLVQYCNAHDDAERTPDRDRRLSFLAVRDGAWAKIRRLARFQEVHGVDHIAGEYLTRWTHPTIRELALLPGFDPDERRVAAALDPPITQADARRALASLEALGLLTRDAAGRLVVVGDGAVATSDVIARQAVRGLYEQVYKELSVRAIDAFGSAERELGLSFVRVPRSGLAEVKELVASARKEIATLCDRLSEEAAARGEEQRVYLASLQLFPVSAPIAPAAEEGEGPAQGAPISE